MIKVSQLWTYPFKSGKGQSQTSTQFDKEGMRGDRRLLALDENGVFVTARKNSQLLQLSCYRNDQGWLLEYPTRSKPCLILEEELSSPISGSLWSDSLKALDAGDEAAAWLSDVLEMPVRIAVWKDQSRYSTKYQLETSFSDASPILVCSEASIRQACHWAGIEADTRRFRPNFVLDGVDAFDEDSWREFRIGDVIFEVLDNCARCVLTTKNPDTGEQHPQREPMVALMKYHSNEAGQPLFGINVKLSEPATEGVILLGDEVQV